MGNAWYSVGGGTYARSRAMACWTYHWSQSAWSQELERCVACTVEAGESGDIAGRVPGEERCRPLPAQSCCRFHTRRMSGHTRDE